MHTNLLSHKLVVAMKKCLFGCFLFTLYSSLVARDLQSCLLPSPSDVDVRTSLETLLTFTNGNIENGYNVSVIEFRIVCKVQGSTKDTYHSLSAIAVYTPYEGAPQNTSIFQLLCFSDTWSPVNDDLSDPSNIIVQNNVSRSDCAACDKIYGDDRCGRELNFTCYCNCISSFSL